MYCICILSVDTSDSIFVGAVVSAISWNTAEVLTETFSFKMAPNNLLPQKILVDTHLDSHFMGCKAHLHEALSGFAIIP